MFVESFPNNGKPYLRLVESKYVTKSNGKKSCKKVCVLSIGPLDKFDDGKPDYVKRLKESFKNGNPLIPSLLPFVDKKPVRENYDISFKEGDPNCIGHNKLFSNALIERIMEEIGVNSFITRYKQLTNYEFDILGFVRLLIYGRILNPASKISTSNQNNDYFSEVIKDMYKYNIYDTLSFLYDYRKNIINWINNRLKKSFKRTTDIIYYDVTNFFFETENADEDYVDGEGNITKGIRKEGVSKEERHLPIVQMGLFMDEQGLPISIEIFPGNTLDHLTMQKALNNTIDNLNLDRFVFVGDRGMYRGDNTYYLTNHNNGYIISKSIEKTKQEEKNWIYKQDDYIKASDDFKYKSRIIKRKVKTFDGYKDITEKVVVYFSKKFYDKQVHENKSFLDFLEKLKENPEHFRISKSMYGSIRKFIKKDLLNDKTGEVLNSKDLKTILDYDKVNKYKESFGYYQIVTSELDMEDRKVIDIYHGLSRIEDQFRTMKSDLETRPIYVRTKEHIYSHLLICMISLIVIRIIQNKINEYTKQEAKNKWNMGLSGSRIQRALNKWTVSELGNGYYRFNDVDDADLKLILDSFNIEIPIKLFNKMELKNIKTSIKIV
ncbi:MAG: IS1634 family transposase [Bacilli bacterium]|nr:IS1634 family transposase [Bacilli bacterium]